MIMIWTTDTGTAKQHTCLARTSCRLDSIDVTPLFPVFFFEARTSEHIASMYGPLLPLPLPLYVLHLRPWRIVERELSSSQVA